MAPDLSPLDRSSNPLAELTYGLDRRLEIWHELAVAIRARVANANDRDYAICPFSTDGERAALDFAAELTRDHEVAPETFERLTRHFNEREIRDIVWLVASEHLYAIASRP